MSLVDLPLTGERRTGTLGSVVTRPREHTWVGAEPDQSQATPVLFHPEVGSVVFESAPYGTGHAGNRLLTATR